MSRAAPWSAAYHSHPLSAPEPSPTDLEMAFAEFIFVIAGQGSSGTDLNVRAYELHDEQLATVTLNVV